MSENFRWKWFRWWWWRLAFGPRHRAFSGTRLVFTQPRSSRPGMPWERFEYVHVIGGLWWRRKGEG